MDTEKNEATEQSLLDILGEPYNIDNLTENSSRKDVEIAAYELYKEATAATMATANMFENNSASHPGLHRNQAINVGLLIRIAKLMKVVLQLSAKGNRGDVLPIIIRCIIESITNLEFLIKKNEDNYYEDYVMHSLGPDRELYDRIQENIQAREGEELPIETRMLKSINRVVTLSGKQITDIPVRTADWGGNFREKLKAIGKEHRYVYYQRIPSHMVHGSWVDLLFNHLEAKDGLFFPKPEWKMNDARQLTSYSKLILEVVMLYLKTHFGQNSNLKPFITRVEDLGNRTNRIEELHELLLSDNSSKNTTQD